MRCDADHLRVGYLMAGAVLTTLPVIAAYIYLQKCMVEGLTAGSVKG